MAAHDAIFATTLLILGVMVIYLLDGWKKSLERKIDALERKIDILTEEITFLRSR